jgi:hypothetical protein
MDGEKEKIKSLGERNDTYSSIGDKAIFNPEKMVERLKISSGGELRKSNYSDSDSDRGSTIMDNVFDDDLDAPSRTEKFKNKAGNKTNYATGEKLYKAKEMMKPMNMKEMEKAEKFAKMLRKK